MLSIAQELADTLDRVSDPVGNQSMVDTWATEFQTEPRGSDLMLAMAGLHSKMEHLRQLVEISDQPPRAKELYISAIDQLMPFVSGQMIGHLNLNQLRNMKQQIGILHLAAGSLNDFASVEVDELTIGSLSEEIGALIDEVTRSELPDTLKSMAIPQLETLLMAVRSYRTLGAEGVTRVYGAAATELARLNSVCATASPETKSMLSKSLAIAKKVGAAIIWTGAVVGGANHAITDGADLLGLVHHAASQNPAEAKTEAPQP